MLSNNEKRRKISMKKQKYKYIYKEINQSPNKWKKKTAKIPNKRLDVLLKQHEQKNYCGRFCYCSPVANRKRKSTAHKETNKGSCRRVEYIGLTACVQNPIYIYIYIYIIYCVSKHFLTDHHCKPSQNRLKWSKTVRIACSSCWVY